MSPAGHWPQLRAAIEAGADAVYFGLTHFSARAKVGFTAAELVDVMSELHGRAVKGYVTFNTLVFDSELAAARRALEAIQAAGVDAVIVQDVAAASLAREVAPDVEVHASTQMSITSAQGAELARQFGCTRVVLGRELSLVDIEKVRRATDVELEVFVHGALCVSYSGQCFSSEAWGGRSANRGQCAQACRLPYDLLVDGEVRDLGPYRYLLSPGDLYTLHQVPELARIGVSCLKIEGRYKDAAYVALTTAAYREALDAVAAGRAHSVTPDDERDLEQVYSRGLGPWFMAGTDHRKVVVGRAPRHRGVLLGEVVGVQGEQALLAPAADAPRPKPGDGVVFDAADRRSPEEPEEGGPVVRVDASAGGLLSLSFLRRTVDLRRVAPGDLLWRTHDAAIDAKVRPYLAAQEPLRTAALDLHVTARVGEQLVLEGSAPAAGGRVRAEVRSGEPLAEATRHGLDAARLSQQLGRLGGTPYHPGSLSVDLAGEPFVPVSELNRLRRLLVEELQRARLARPRRAVNPAAASVEAPPKRAVAAAETAPPAGGELHLLLRTPEQLDSALELVSDRRAALPIASVTLDYLELYGLRPAVERTRAAGVEVRVASPRILKPSEQNISKFLVSLGCALLVRSGGLLYDLARLPAAERPELYGDFSLNATNAAAAETYLSFGLTRLTPGNDLDGAQLASLAREIGGNRLEAIAYQHMPVFHTEHCVFCRFLSTGKDFRDCGHPCEKHRLVLRGPRGGEHPVMADVGCRNTVFSGEPQTATRHLTSWWDAGVRAFRLEFVHETPAQVAAVATAFSLALAELGRGAYSPSSAEERLRAAVGPITEGSLFVPRAAGTAPDAAQLLELPLFDPRNQPGIG